MRIIIERVYPYLFGLFAVFIAETWSVTFPKGDDIFTASITIGAIFTGFLATSQSIIITFKSPLVSRLRQTPYFKLLLSYLGEAIWSSLFLCILSLGGYFLTSYPLSRYFTDSWYFTATCTFFTFFRITSLLNAIFNKTNP